MADLEEVLMYRNTIASAVCGEVGFKVCFDVLPSGRALNIQQVQHEFSDGIGFAHIRRLNVRGIRRGHDIIPVAVLGAERVGCPAQFKPMAEKVVHHIHAPAVSVLQDHDCHTGCRHP